MSGGRGLLFRCKGPEVGSCWSWWRNFDEAGVAERKEQRGGWEGREMTGQLGRALGTVGMTLAFAVSEVGAVEGSQQRRSAT